MAGARRSKDPRVVDSFTLDEPHDSGQVGLRRNTQSGPKVRGRRTTK